MASKRLGQDAKCSKARRINSRGKQSSQKKASLKDKFNALLNWLCIPVIPIVERSPLMILLLNVLHVKILHTKIVLSYLTYN